MPCMSLYKHKGFKEGFFSCSTVRCNPYCEVIIDGQKGNIRTDIKKKTAAPVWDEEFTMYGLFHCVHELFGEEKITRIL